MFTFSTDKAVELEDGSFFEKKKKRATSQKKVQPKPDLGIRIYL